jgi:hypothetical protein
VPNLCMHLSNAYVSKMAHFVLWLSIFKRMMPQSSMQNKAFC